MEANGLMRSLIPFCQQRDRFAFTEIGREFALFLKFGKTIIAQQTQTQKTLSPTLRTSANPLTTSGSVYPTAIVSKRTIGRKVIGSVYLMNTLVSEPPTLSIHTHRAS